MRELLSGLSEDFVRERFEIYDCSDKYTDSYLLELPVYHDRDDSVSLIVDVTEDCCYDLLNHELIDDLMLVTGKDLKKSKKIARIIEAHGYEFDYRNGWISKSIDPEENLFGSIIEFIKLASVLLYEYRRPEK